MVSLLLLPTLLCVWAAPEKAEADPFQTALVEAVHHFAEEGRLAHVRAVLDKYPKLLDARRGRRLGKPTHGDDFTPLQTAARRGEAEVVALLIAKGADLNAADGYGYTPLHLAAEGGHLDVVKRLVTAGAKVDAKTTALPGGFAPGGPPDAAPQKTDPIPARTARQIAEDLERAEVVAFLKSIK